MKILLRAVSALAALTILLTISPVGAADIYSLVARRTEKIRRCPYAYVSKIGDSVQGRPIYGVVFTKVRNLDKRAQSPCSGNRAPSLILVISGQHGNEQIAVHSSLRFMESLARGDAGLAAGTLEESVLVFVPVVNPDGFATNKRCNAAGVDLNRNWASPNQPETLAVTRFVNRLQPDVIIDQHQWTDEDPHRPNCLEAPAYPANAGGRLACTLAELAVAKSPLGLVSYSQRCNASLAHRHFANSGIGAILVETGPGWPIADRMEAYNGIVRSISAAVTNGGSTAAAIAELPHRPRDTAWLASLCRGSQSDRQAMPQSISWPAILLAGVGCFAAWSVRARRSRQSVELEEIRSLRSYAMTELVQLELPAREKLVLIQRRRLRPTDRHSASHIATAT